MSDPRYQSYMGLGPKQIAHWEHWSNPDAETYLTEIDYYDHPRQCRLKLKELYPQLGLHVPEKDTPKPRPEDQEDRGKGRWGDEYRDHWQQEEANRRFKSFEEMLQFSPLAQGDFTGWHATPQTGRECNIGRWKENPSIRPKQSLAKETGGRGHGAQTPRF